MRNGPQISQATWLGFCSAWIIKNDEFSSQWQARSTALFDLLFWFCILCRAAAHASVGTQLRRASSCPSCLSYRGESLWLCFPVKTHSRSFCPIKSAVLLSFSQKDGRSVCFLVRAIVIFIDSKILLNCFVRPNIYSDNYFHYISFGGVWKCVHFWLQKMVDHSYFPVLPI